MRARRFDHVVTFGYNCELSARFFQNFGFVDSTLFSWAGADYPDEMAYAIGHYEDIFTGEIASPTRVFPMFFCKKTKVGSNTRRRDAPRDHPPAGETHRGTTHPQARRKRDFLTFLRRSG